MPAPDLGSLPRAAALAYKPGDSADGGAPRVVAKGQWRLAEEIIKRAREAGVPVHESRELVALLMQVDLDEQIPPALYLVVAEVLVWVYNLERRNASQRHVSAALENSIDEPWE
jgi:flagellar biosynthesis protein